MVLVLNEFIDYARYASDAYKNTNPIKSHTSHNLEVTLFNLMSKSIMDSNASKVTRPMLKGVINDYYISGYKGYYPQKVGVTAYKIAIKYNQGYKKASIGDMARNMTEYADRVNPSNADGIILGLNRSALLSGIFGVFLSATGLGLFLGLLGAIYYNRKAKEITTVKDYKVMKQQYNRIMKNRKTPKAVKESETMDAWGEVIDIIDTAAKLDSRLSKEDVDIIKENINIIVYDLRDMKSESKDLREAHQIMLSLKENYDMRR